jgi:hypothetical protein
MMLLAFAVLFMPASAVLAALVVGVMRRDDELDDAGLVRHFLFVMVVVMLALWGTSRADPVRRVVDPSYRVARVVDADPVVDAVVRLDPANSAALREDVTVRLLRGETVDTALAAWRPWLAERATDRLGFADQETHVAWGRVVAASLAELAAAHPEACWRMDIGGPPGFAFTATQQQAFRDAVVAIHESADRGMRRAGSADEQPPDYDQRVRASIDLHDRLDADFGEDVGRSLRRLDRPPPPDVPWSLLCSARRRQVDAMLALPRPFAASLLDSLLRMPR